MKTRKELYKIIKDNKLEKGIYNKYNCNYTNLSNSILNSYIDFYIESEKMIKEENKVNTNNKEKKQNFNSIKKETTIVKINSKNIEGTLSRLIETLIKKRIIIDSEIKYILG